MDHVLAMVTVGLLAALLGKRALWAVPASFVAMMLVGGLLGLAGIEVPAVEAGILASIVVLGLVVATGKTWSVGPAVGLVGMFALFHGYAHGAEMPIGVGALSYSLGFMGATALLHGAGIIIGLTAVKHRQIIRLAGAASALAGVALAVI
jgi:urease accessory protein